MSESRRELYGLIAKAVAGDVEAGRDPIESLVEIVVASARRSEQPSEWERRTERHRRRADDLRRRAVLLLDHADSEGCEDEAACLRRGLALLRRAQVEEDTAEVAARMGALALQAGPELADAVLDECIRRNTGPAGALALLREYDYLAREFLIE